MLPLLLHPCTFLLLHARRRQDLRDAGLDLDLPCLLIHDHAAVADEGHVFETLEPLSSAVEVVGVGWE